MRRLWFALAMVASFVLAPGARGDDLAEAARAIAFGDNARGYAILLRLAQDGNPTAQTRIAILLAEPRPDLQQDARAAFEWIQRAVAQGHAPAMRELGGFYRDGRGLPRDWVAALAWYDRAATAGDWDADDQAARLIFQGGHGLVANPIAGRQRAVLAQHRSLMAAEAGNVGAMIDFAITAYSHPILGRLEELARMWLERAARTNDPYAQFVYSVMLQDIRRRELRGQRDDMQGVNVPTELDVHGWIGVAAAGGDPQAQRRFEGLRARLTPEAFAEVEQRVRDHSPRRRP